MEVTTTAPSRRTASARLATLGLLGVTAAWGSTFFLLKDVVERVPVSDFLAVRFALAAVAVWLIAPRAVAALTPAERRYGVVLGVVYGGAQLLQTVGLQTTSASVSGFVTGMYVVFTPLLGALVLRTRLSWPVWTAVGMATAGLGLLSLQGFAIGGGEALTLAGALLVQTWAQAHLTATRAAIIMTMEPVWAAGFATAFGGEALGPRLLVGGALVLAAMYLVELGPRSRGEPDVAEEVGGVTHVGPV